MTTTWWTVDEAKGSWVGAPADDDLELLLDVAKAEIIAYAPALDPDDVVTVTPDEGDPYEVQVIPAGYRWAQLAHARNIWNAAKVNPSGGFGADGETFALTPFPLDWAIKQRLRPAAMFGGPTG